MERHVPLKRFLTFWYYSESLVSVIQSFSGSFDTYEEAVAAAVDGDTLEIIDTKLARVYLLDNANANTPGARPSWGSEYPEEIDDAQERPPH